MTAFIESFATQQLLPPWTATDARRFCFVFRMERDLIATYLAKYFNGRFGDCAPAPFRYEPVAGAQFGMVSVTLFPNIMSTNTVEPHPVSGGQIWNKISHNEVYLAFPAIRYAVTPDGLMRDPRLVWIQPAAYTNNDTIVFSAREIWGTDMFLATIDRHDTDDFNALHLDVGLIGMKTFDPHAEERLLSVMHVAVDKVLEGGLLPAIEANPELSAFVDLLFKAGMLGGVDAPGGADTEKYPHHVELNNLKQFRDCYDMGAAIYRAIIASQVSHARLRNLVLYDAKAVDLAFMWSDSLREFIETILGNTGPTDPTPPAPHADDHSPQPSCAHIDWQLPQVKLDVALAFSFIADIDFRVLGALHTYGAVEA